jgi:hypothetical protein
VYLGVLEVGWLDSCTGSRQTVEWNEESGWTGFCEWCGASFWVQLHAHSLPSQHREFIACLVTSVMTNQCTEQWHISTVTVWEIWFVNVKKELCYAQVLCLTYSTKFTFIDIIITTNYNKYFTFGTMLFRKKHAKFHGSLLPPFDHDIPWVFLF